MSCDGGVRDGERCRCGYERDGSTLDSRWEGEDGFGGEAVKEEIACALPSVVDLKVRQLGFALPVLNPQNGAVSR